VNIKSATMSLIIKVDRVDKDWMISPRLPKPRPESPDVLGRTKNSLSIVVERSSRGHDEYRRSDRVHLPARCLEGVYFALFPRQLWHVERVLKPSLKVR